MRHVSPPLLVLYCLWTKACKHMQCPSKTSILSTVCPAATLLMRFSASNGHESGKFCMKGSNYKRKMPSLWIDPSRDRRKRQQDEKVTDREGV